MSKASLVFGVLATLLLGSAQVQGHGFIKTPVPRNFKYNDQYCPHCLNAGGPGAVGDFGATWPDGRAGICGDRWTDAAPRDHEFGGTWGMDVTPTAVYEEGSEVEFSFVVTAHHKGRFELRLCDLGASDPGNDDGLTHECLEEHVLERADGLGAYWYLPLKPGKKAAKKAGVKWEKWRQGVGGDHYTAAWTLPAGLKCERCVLQWHYQTGNSCQPPCELPLCDPAAERKSKSNLATCGEDGTPWPEEFFNCADIRIVEVGGDLTVPEPTIPHNTSPGNSPRPSDPAPSPAPSPSPGTSPAPSPAPTPSSGPAGGGACTTPLECFCAERDDIGFFCHPDDPNAYITCAPGIAVSRACAAGLHFDNTYQYCNWPDQTPTCPYDSLLDSSSPSPTPSPAPSSPSPAPACTTPECFCADREGVTGFYCHPNDASQYITCAPGVAVARPCAPGLHFDNTHQYCNWPDQTPACPYTWGSGGGPAPAVTSPPPPASSPPPSPPPAPMPPPAPSPPPPGPAAGWEAWEPAPGDVMVCYYTNWVQTRWNMPFTTAHVDPNLCTHINFAFGGIADGSYLVQPWQPQDTQYYQQLTALRDSVPGGREHGPKIMMSLGGWTFNANWSTKHIFSDMVSSAENRAKFVAGAIAFLRHWDLDGLDLDWEYPAAEWRGGAPTDKANFVLLLEELLLAFRDEAVATQRPRLQLTLAVGIGKPTADAGYDVLGIAGAADFVNLMTYDMHGAWETRTGHNAPLDDPGNGGGAGYPLGVKWAVQYWLDRGCPAYKLVLGMAAYGRSFKLANAADTAVGSPTAWAGAGGEPGPVTGEAGFLAYHEIRAILERDDPYVYRDAPYGVPHFVYGDGNWVSYDDVASIAAKTDFLREKALRGGMVWALDLDAFEGGEYPLICRMALGVGIPSAVGCDS